MITWTHSLMLPWLRNPTCATNPRGERRTWAMQLLSPSGRARRGWWPSDSEDRHLLFRTVIKQAVSSHEKIFVPFHQLWLNNILPAQVPELQPLIYIETGLWKRSPLDRLWYTDKETLSACICWSNPMELIMIHFNRETLTQAALCAKWISELSHRNEVLFLGFFYVGYHGIPSEHISYFKYTKTPQKLFRQCLEGTAHK